MKNFTKQITNKTLFKPTRWLLIALMMLLGTSSAWAADCASAYINTWDGSKNTQVKLYDGCSLLNGINTWYSEGISYEISGSTFGIDFFVMSYHDNDQEYTNGKVYYSIDGGSTQSGTLTRDGEYGGKKKYKFYLNVAETNATKLDVWITVPHSDDNWKLDNDKQFTFKFTRPTTGEDCTTDDTQIRVEFKNPSGWTPYIWAWVEGGSNFTGGSWPGMPMIYDSETGYYYYKINRDNNTSTNKTVNVIFSNNGSDQKSTISGLKWSKVYRYDKDGKQEDEDCLPPSCTPPDAFSISIDETAICSGGIATITIPNEHTAESYKWCTKNGDTYGEETTIDNKSFTVSTAGTYVVRAYNSTCMTESNAVTLTVDEKPTITVTEPSAICNGSEIDLSDYVETDYGTLTYNDNSQSVFTPNDNTTYNIVATNGTCSTTESITVTVANETKPQQLTPSGNVYNRLNCWAINITVTNNTNTILAVLYKGYYNIEPTPVVDGTEYKIGDEIGEGNVVHKDNAAAIVIDNLDPQQDYTCVIYQYTNTCKIYSDPLVIPFKKNVPEFTPIEITPNGTSVTLRTEATHIGTNIAGVVIDEANFYYKKTNDAEWNTIAATKSGDYNKVCTATITNLTQGATYKFKFEASNNSCTDNKVTVEGTENVTIECPTVTPPALTGAAYCGGQNSVTLPTVSGYWYDSETGGAEVNSPVNVANTTTYYATNKIGECESVRVPYIITINPVPTINITADNATPVLNQEVLLTASGNNIASVAWSASPGSITPNPDDSKYAILTHSSAEAVTVTATATSANGCETTLTKEVTFSEEGNCEPTITTHTTKTKVRVEKISNWSSIKIYAHSGQSTGNWPGADMTEGTGEDAGYYVYKFESVSSNFKVIFNNGESNGENQTVSGTATKGKVCTYTIGANSCNEDNNSRRCLEVTTSDYKTTTPAEITAPAVNTVSVTSTQGSGVVNFTGQVVKTGCAANNKIYVGYQYKLATDEWPTTGVTAANQAGANPLVLNPLGNPNGLDPFTANIPLTDGTYDFRAYVINGYDRGNSSSSNYDQGLYYGLSKRVTVSLQQQAITSVTIEHADRYGNTINNVPTYCAGTTAYIKLTHDGTPYKGDVVWTSTANHDFSKVEDKENLFSYIVKGEDNVTASVKNDENDDYVSSNPPLNIEVYPVPNMPNFDIDKTTICSTDGDGAVITVTNPVVGITYQVYKKVGDNETAHGNAVTYNNGDPNPTINSIKTAGTYFVKAWNIQCDNKVERSLTEAEVTIVDAATNSIAITPTSKEVNPWMPTTFIVTKTGSYNYTLTCAQINAQEGSATVSSTKGNIEYNYSFVPTNNDVQVTFTWTNMNSITGAVAPILQDKTTGITNELRGTDNSVTKLITPNAQGNVIVAVKFEFAGDSQTTADYTYTNLGDAPEGDAIITQKGDTYIIKFPKPADAQIVDGQVTFNPIRYNVTAKLNVDVQGCGTTVATSNVTLTPLTEVCP